MLPPHIPWFRPTRGCVELPAVGLRLAARPGTGPRLGGAVLAGVLDGPFTFLDLSDLTDRQVQQEVRPAFDRVEDPSSITVATTMPLRDGAPPSRWRHRLATFGARLGRHGPDVLLLDDRDGAPGPRTAAGSASVLAEELARARDEGAVRLVALSGAAAALEACLERGLPALVLDHDDRLARTTRTGPVRGNATAGLEAVRVPLRRSRASGDLGSAALPSARLRAVCAEFGIDPRTALLQSHLRDLATTTTVLRVADEKAVRAVARSAGTWVPEEFWVELASVGAPPGPRR